MFTRSQLVLFGGVGLVALLGVLVFTGVLPGLKRPRSAPPPAPVHLTLWGVFDRKEIYEPLLAAYRQAFPHVTLTYIEKPAASYGEDLLNAMALGQGPDIFMIHNRWLGRWQDKMTPAPEVAFTPQGVDQVFADVVSFDLVREGKVWAVPFSLDTLALFYNRDFFNDARLVAAPKTWEEFLEYVQKLTRRDEVGNIIRAGAALGSAENVNRAADILALLMLQSGSSITDSRNGRPVFTEPVEFQGERINPGERALKFYTDFANPGRSVYTWNRRQHNSLDAFISGGTAMMINYGYQIPVIKSRAPHLRFAVAPAPQPARRSHDVAFASYWPFAVSKASRQADAAWHFLAWVTEKEVLRPFLTANARTSPRRDLLAEQLPDPVLGPFASQAFVARSYVAVDNLLVESAFAAMIEAVVKDEKNISQALFEATQKINAGVRR